MKVPTRGDYYSSAKKVDARDNSTIKGTASSDSLSGTNTVGKDSRASGGNPSGELGGKPTAK